MKTPRNLDHPRLIMFYKVLKFLRNQDSLQILAENQTFKKIEENVLTAKFNNHPWLFIKEVSSMFDSAIENSGKRSKQYKAAVDLKEIFSNQMDVIMEEQGYCCGRWYKEEARTISCSGANNCKVLPNTVYYRYEGFTFCQECFSKFQEDIFSFKNQTFDKKLFAEYFLQERHDEKFTRCIECYRRFHEVCVLYCGIFNEVFVCKNCRKTKNIKVRPPIRASMIPPTACDQFITKFLESHGINTNGQLTIRMLSNESKQHYVDEIFRRFHTDISCYPYQNCSLFTFFDTGNDSDICFFGIFFHIYGPECPEPNRNSSYISYMDSVNLLPSIDRTKIYRLILLGLFEFLQKIGSTKIFLWSCPPKQRNDYIFYSKPLNMKIPNLQRLSSWYQKLFKMGLQLKVIQNYYGINSYAKKKNWTGIEDIPFLEGDVWITRTTEAIESREKENKKINKEILKAIKRLKNEKSNTKKKRLNTTLASLIAKQQETDEGKKIWELMKIQLSGYNSQYFVVELPPLSKDQQPPQVMELEKNMINSNWLNDRSLFVDFFWSFMLEFSSVRKAQYSTYIMLFRILAENRVCIQCKKAGEDEVTGSLLCQKCWESENLDGNSTTDQADQSINLIDVPELERETPQPGPASALQETERTTPFLSSLNIEVKYSDNFNLDFDKENAMNVNLIGDDFEVIDNEEIVKNATEIEDKVIVISEDKSSSTAKKAPMTTKNELYSSSLPECQDFGFEKYLNYSFSPRIIEVKYGCDFDKENVMNIDLSGDDFEEIVMNAIEIEGDIIAINDDESSSNDENI